MSITLSSQAVVPDPTASPFAAQTNISPFTLMFNAIQSLLQVFNLQSLIRPPGQSNSDAWSLLKILVIGLIAEVVRRNLNAHALLAYFSERFLISVSFSERDPCYDWVLAWLSKQPTWKTIRTATISTVLSGNVSGASARLGAATPMTSTVNPPQIIYTIPEINKTYWVRTSRGYWISVTRKRQDVGSYADLKMEYVLHLRIITIKDADVLYDLIHEIRETYIQSQGEKIRIFSPDQRVRRWKCYATCTKRPLSSVVLEKSVKEKVVSDAQEFLESRSWYTDRGIPYRRGYLFYGKPGTGKTSFINGLAGELGLDIYNISPSTSGIDDGTLADLINQIPQRALLLMEDIDAAFIDPGINRGDQQKNQGPNEKRQGINESKSGITLSGLLNALDGVGAGEGRILVATTNYYDRLDEALRRPGRIDLAVKFQLATRHQAREQFRRFYLPHSITKERDTGIILAKAKSNTFIQHSDLSKDGSTITEEKHFEDKDLNPDDLKFTARFSRLADQFVEDFQEFVISSASLQQYLLMYKTNPIEAVANFKTWVEAEIIEKARKQKETADSESLAEHQGSGHSLGIDLDEKVHSSMPEVQVSEEKDTETTKA